MAGHEVTCTYCNIKFNRDEEECMLDNNHRWIHKKCYEKKYEMIDQDYLALEEYLKSLFKIKVLTKKIIIQIKSYKEIEGYTYSGILKTLQWWFGEQKHPISDANGGIGIVPYIYEQVEDIYKKRYKAANINSLEQIKSYDIEIEKIFISPPQCKPHEKKLFKLD